MNILQSIAANVQAHPNQTAFVLNALDKSESITWSELGSYSDRIGTHIVQNIADQIPVIVYGHKDPLMIASFIACSKSGRAYCPVDISVPEGRLQDIVKEVGPSLIIALEELLVNVCSYAYADQEEPGEVQVSYVYLADPQSITIQISDQGTPFDPLTRKDPKKPESIQDMGIGGLGIFMVKRTMDDVSYEYKDGLNMLTVTKTL